MKLDPKVVAKIIELHGHGLNPHEICYLVNRDHPPRNVFEKPWTSKRVQTLLKSIEPQEGSQHGEG